MTKGAKTFMPACRVKIAGRDITGFLSDGGHVSTTKDLYAPKGRWEVVIADKPLKEGGLVIDSLYGLIAPMDTAEIRLCRNAHEYPGGTPPVVMRGFVRSVTREEQLDAGGRPNRVVRISGDDYGCIPELVQISIMHGAALQQTILPVLRLDQLGIQNSIIPAGEFIQTLLIPVNKQIGDMSAHTGDPGITSISYRGSVSVGEVYTRRLEQAEGTIWKLMFDFADTPWNELYIEDTDAGPELVYRPTPWKDLDGGWIPNMGQSVNAETVRFEGGGITDSQQEIELVRSTVYQRNDAHVYNVYWAKAWALPMDPMPVFSNALATQVDGVHILDYEHAAKSIYGVRVLTLDTTQAPSGTPWPDGGVDQRPVVKQNFDDWLRQKREWMVAANKDNVLRDEGTLVVRGSEKFKIGRYYLLDRGTFLTDHYLTRVSHTYVPYREYVTHLNFIRANNYILRQGSAPSAFLREGRKGVHE